MRDEKGAAKDGERRRRDSARAAVDQENPSPVQDCRDRTADDGSKAEADDDSRRAEHLAAILGIIDLMRNDSDLAEERRAAADTLQDATNDKGNV